MEASRASSQTAPQSSSTSVIARVRRLQERGLFLQARAEGERELGPLIAWPTTEGQVQAGRVALQLGAPRLSSRLLLRAWRRDRRDPDAAFHAAFCVLFNNGPLSALRLARRFPCPAEAVASERADWLMFEARLFGELRDFQFARARLDEAEALGPVHPWYFTECALLLESMDQMEAAHDAARQALSLEPDRPGAVRIAAHLLFVTGRDDEGLALLSERAGRLESAAIHGQLARHLFDQERYEEADQSLRRYAELSPMMERRVADGLDGFRSDVAYAKGDVKAAVSLARASRQPFHLALAERLEKPGVEPKRVVLPTSFVRQHYRTCGPATLATISRYFGRPSEHLEIAETICYDGTTAHAERRWAIDNGWEVKEFRVTWESAKALIDRGLPFTLTTVEPGSAHLQAVVGYETARRAWYIRDPGVRDLIEVYADGALERQQAWGPRGMVLVPEAESHRLEGIELADTGLYDLLFELHDALFVHERDKASACLEAMGKTDPDARLYWQGRRALADFDGDGPGGLEAHEALCRLFPEETSYLLSKLSSLANVRRYEDRIEDLRKACTPQAHPILWRSLGLELAQDGRCHEEAALVFGRVLRLRPSDALAWRGLAEITWVTGRRDEALELYRFAACLEELNEAHVSDYFVAAHFLGRTDEVLAFLRHRFEAFGDRSSLPAETLAWALERLERREEALAVMRESLTRRPDDGAVRLQAAEQARAFGLFEEAREHLRAAEGRSRPAAFHRIAAQLAETVGESNEALEHWRVVLRFDPPSPEAHAACARLSAATEGRAAALSHLREALARFPHGRELHRLFHDWLREEGDEAEEAALRDLLEVSPDDGWAHRELALVLGRQGRFEEALAEVEVADAVEPAHSYNGSTRGHLHLSRGELPEARAAFEEAIRLSATNGAAIRGLVDACGTDDEREAALELILSELLGQSVCEDGVYSFWEAARAIRGPERTIEDLERLRDARPESWQNWSATVEHQADMGREEAVTLGEQATRRFPLIPQLWADLAYAHRAAKEADREIEALSKACALAPSWGAVHQRLAARLRDEGEAERAREILEQAVSRCPLDAMLRGEFACGLWDLGEREPAVAHLEKALSTAAELGPEWQLFSTWSAELGRPEAAVDLARRLCEARPGDATVWSALARALPPDAIDERVEALRRGLEVEPRRIDLHDDLATVLADAGRFEEALAACLPEAYEMQHPALSARAAWVVATQGRIEEAADRMEAVLAQSPNNVWGARCLAEWRRELGEPEAFVAAARRVAEINPSDAYAHGLLAEALIEADKAGEARGHLELAVYLDKGYAWAAGALADQMIGADQLDEAEALLSRCFAAVEDPYAAAKLTELRCRIRDQEGAIEAFRMVCESSVDVPWAVETATKAMYLAHWKHEASMVIEAALQGEAPLASLGTEWGKRIAPELQVGERRVWMNALLAKGEVGALAAGAWIERLVESNSSGKLLRFIDTHETGLRRNPSGWGTVGWALVTLNENLRAIDWLADWEKRGEEAPSWALNNLALALRNCGRIEEANRVSHAVVERPPDNLTGTHHLWLSIDAGIEGSAEVNLHLQQCEPAELEGPYYRFLYSLAMSLCVLVTYKNGRRAFDIAREHLAVARKEHPHFHQDSRVLLPLYRLAIVRVARRRGGLLAWLWCLWRWFPLM